MSSVGHLVRRFAGSLSWRRPGDAFAAAHLSAPELALWRRFSAADQRHSVRVAERLLAAHPCADRHEVAGALLHDIGKLDAQLGTAARVVATIVTTGDRSRRHRDHERIGAAMLRALGSDPRLVDLVAGVPSPARSRLESADDV